ncbi:MAG: 4Fe-4S binding protein [Xanthomonadales bacterium]|nr:4Fe-4S binding protein [Gammaproteobacteria bacterium]MBT8064018.1 4Fe-4S binding protein [Gammaproteobacteria bacterium]NNJ65038.1 4Fe-4S binding protein [Xanthomonadales bacterium]NNK37673.1 4Fe-4S binding protein [Xanthomonadales bacterium]
MTEATHKYLVIDLAKCDHCDSCRAGADRGSGSGFSRDCTGAMLALREHATFALICRRCQHASCIEACPFDALERTDEGTIRRHNLRCVSCKSCAVACPFGTIYTELLPFYNVTYEQACRAELADTGNVRSSEAVGAASAAMGVTDEQDSSRLKPLSLPQEPPCSLQCPEGAIEYRSVGDDEESVHIIDEFLAAKVRAWVRAERPEEAAA